MAQQIINIGTVANDGTGDTIRDGGAKINANFTELYAALTGLLDFKGSTDCSANPNYPTASKGDYYLVSVAGKIGGAAGMEVQAGDSYFATADNAGGTQAAVGASWTVIQGNLVVDNDTALAADSATKVPTQHAVKAYVDAAALSAPGSYTDEKAQDAVAAMITQSGLLTASYNDAGNAETLDVPAAVASDLNTGTSTSKAVTPDALAGSNFGKAIVTLQVSDPGGSAIAVGDGKAYYRVPSALNGMNLVAVAAALTTASTSGIPTIQIANVTDAVDMLSTKLTIDANETDSSTAATAAVIDGAHDDVATADMLRIDIDVSGTGAKGLIVELQFQLP